MIKQWWWAINSSGLGLYLIGLALLVGISTVVDRGGVDHQGAVVLTQYDQPVQEEHFTLVPREESALAELGSTEAP